MKNISLLVLVISFISFNLTMVKQIDMTNSNTTIESIALASECDGYETYDGVWIGGLLSVDCQCYQIRVKKCSEAINCSGQSVTAPC